MSVLSVREASITIPAPGIARIPLTLPDLDQVGVLGVAQLVLDVERAEQPRLVARRAP